MERHGAVKGATEYASLLAARRSVYRNRGRGVGLQRAVQGD